jgi:predicted enzyme related to lactoylglutathione lyase
LKILRAYNAGVARVIGVGGVFLRARDPDSLGAWYSEALGIDMRDGAPAIFSQRAPGGYLVVSLFEQSSTYIGDPARQSAMANFIVDNIDAVVERLDSCGVMAEPVKSEPYGRFSWAFDPEGNRFELWEPAVTEPDGAVEVESLT